ncbi:GtrA family protein [Ruegeria sp. Ofav3-42]|uniref:GtrA family protein n=1 Tax=Ruegeria sp. Ofav3-42 TaxID=2917759 RepID=UPI001EF4D02D|nr:GtrA family protein [Ruegeria sp. Ofav3-42]MCG7522018.1 GtrA family protein [Ruegeria sp. Ofav3-42]
MPDERSIFSHSMLWQVLRFGLGGVGVNLTLYGLYLVVTPLGVEPVMASSLVFAIGIPFSFVVHRRFTFCSTEARRTRKALFAIAYLTGYLVQISTLYILFYHIGFPHQIAQFGAMLLVAALMFVVQKLLVFRK